MGCCQGQPGKGPSRRFMDFKPNHYCDFNSRWESANNNIYKVMSILSNCHFPGASWWGEVQPLHWGEACLWVSFLPSGSFWLEECVHVWVYPFPQQVGAQVNTQGSSKGSSRGHLQDFNGHICIHFTLALPIGKSKIVPASGVPVPKNKVETPIQLCLITVEGEIIRY